MLLADGKADGGGPGVPGECQREGELDRRAVRLFALALELQHLRRTNARRLEGSGIGGSVVALQEQQRQSFPV